jgi:GAF domain-containing protein
MGPSADDGGIGDVLVQMGGVLLSEQTVDRILQLVTELTDRTVGSASAVSVTLIKDDVPYTPNASQAVARELDEVQYAHAAGPCLDAAAHGRMVNTALADVTDRWPEFVAASRAQGVGAILSVPLTIQDRSLGALNIYSRESERFDQADETTAALLALQAAAVLANAEAFANATALNAQLRDALESRDLIGQAKGILMARESCTADAAFDILRRVSQRTNRKLREIAAELVDSVSEQSDATE